MLTEAGLTVWHAAWIFKWVFGGIFSS